MDSLLDSHSWITTNNSEVREDGTNLDEETYVVEETAGKLTKKIARRR